MKALRCILSVMLLVAVLGLTSMAVVNAEGAADTPYFVKLDNYDSLMDNYKAGLNDTYKLWTNDGTMTVEGKVWSTTYTVKDGNESTSDLDIIQHYSNEILKMKGSLVFDDRDDSGRRDITGKFYNDQKKLVWVEAVAWNGGDDYRITVIEKP